MAGRCCSGNTYPARSGYTLVEAIATFSMGWKDGEHVTVVSKEYGSAFRFLDVDR